MATPDPHPKRVEITISTRTLVTVLGVLALAWAFIEARQAVLWVFVALFLAIGFIAWVSGSGRTPVAVRHGTGTAIGFVRSGSQRAGLDTGRLGVFLDTYKGAIRGVVLGVALLLYVMADHPTGRFTIILLIGAAVVLLVTELLARPPADAAVEPPSTAPGPRPS